MEFYCSLTAASRYLRSDRGSCQLYRLSYTGQARIAIYNRKSSASIQVNDDDNDVKLEAWAVGITAGSRGVPGRNACDRRHTYRIIIIIIIAIRYGLDRLGSNLGTGEIFRTRPDRPWGPPSLLYNRYRVFPGGKAAGAWRWPPTPPCAEVKEIVDLY